MMKPFDSIDTLQEALRDLCYIADRGLATSIYLAYKLNRPLFLEGEAGVGKTEVAKMMAGILGTDLIRLQCYEGLDIHHAVYEWNYTRQIMNIRLMEARGEQPSEADLFSRDYLLRRPLLQAIEHRHDKPVVLLVDEIDRSDEEFEAFLLEVLSEYQVTIPELGPIRATHRPHVVLTSNRSRELSDALRRRCLYLWIDYPSFDKELEIVRARIPAISEALSAELTRVIQVVRKLNLVKVPGVAETLDWAEALAALNTSQLDREVVRETAGCFLKDESDLRRFEAELDAGRLKDILEAAP